MQNIKIVNTSDYTGPSALGVAGIYMEDTHNADILNSDIYSAGTAIRVRNSAEDDIVNNLLIKNSMLKAEAAAALEATNSNLIIYASSLDSLSDGSAIACYAGSAAVNGCGALNLEGTNVLVSQHSAINSNNVGVFITGKKETQLDIIDSTINAQKAAFSVNKGDTTIAVYNSRASIKLTPSITSKENRLLEALDGSKVDFSLYNVYTRGDIFADESSRVNVLLSGASLLEGNIAGVDTLEISRNASWKMTADNHLKEMLFTGGSILLPDVGPNNQFHTLTIESLTGAGLFGLNTNLQTMQGDRLNITKDLYGTFLLRIANSGTEPEDADAMLKVVQAPSNTALFALYGGKVDAGVWQYDLVQKGNDWYLANSNRPNTPDVPDAPDAPDHGGTPPSQPSLTPSANAVLNMAAAPVTIFNNELQNLRQRRGDGKSGEEGGVWGRYIHQNARINSGISSWRLGQNGFELGGDKAVAVREGDLFVGVMASITHNSVRDDRGGNSQIDSYSAGAYASWFADSGLYIDAVVKANRFNNRLHTQMSDGTAVSGGYNQNGLGGALESGWHIALADNYWAEPFARLSAFRAGGKSVTLSNGMKAQIRQPSSLQAETGLQFGKRIQLEKASLNPYLKASVAHEFVKTGKVWLNDSWDFNEGAAATSGRYGAGIDIRLTKDASLFTEADYQKGRTIESPVTANLGFRLNF
ncbi:autotransporter outer membrane beta-barrel domain-containing protein [Erwinia sp. CGal63]|uniref:autotransporter outer membrane beta-barrel domain-containing protein n=1 Tax=Erwinia sp. CGal63 TaxID=2919889 RepID=UPI00300ADF82